MRAVRNTPGGVRVVDVPAPDSNADGVRVRVRSASICGSDLEMVRTGMAVTTLGHEIAGVLDDGTAVAIVPYTSCGECEQCRSGQPQACRTATANMLGISRDGGMADEVVIDAASAVPLPAGLRIEDASLVEPTAVAMHACTRGGVGDGMRVGVIGAGTIGLLCGAVARQLGADVWIAPRHRSQQQAAEALGLTVERPSRCDVVIEAAGTTSGFDSAAKSCARMGTVVLASTTWEHIPISFLDAQLRELTIAPTFAYSDHEFAAAARVLSEHPGIEPALVTHRFGLDDAAEAFAVAADRANGAIKVVLHP